MSSIAVYFPATKSCVIWRVFWKYFYYTYILKQNTTLSNMNIILKIMSNHIDTRYHKTRHFVSTCTVINFYSIFHSAVKTFFRSSKSSQHWSFLRILMHFLVLFVPTGTVNSARPRWCKRWMPCSWQFGCRSFVTS